MPSAILPSDPATPPLCTAYSLDASRKAELDTVYQLVLKEPPLIRALNDLIESIGVPHVSCVNCGRVIDSIRRMITPDTKVSNAKAWQSMHSALNISQSFQEWIANQAKGPRHGDPAFVPGNVTAEITHGTWTAMNRFIEYRKCGNTPLTAPQFPRLS
jgi:hypothetical protein